MISKLPLNIPQANWNCLDDLTPWSAISSRQLAVLLGVHLQTINNWNVRGLLPEPIKAPNLPRNKNFFRIVDLRSHFEGISEESVIWDWVMRVIPNETFTCPNIRQFKSYIYACHDLLNLKRPNVPAQV